ncbi:BRCT domain-containing protein [Vibrio parahaemolyticus]|nr:BRCT domain-containing protein [Vibrio parahaemolyticus]
MTEHVYDRMLHEAALTRFNNDANQEKCMEHLLGICTGLCADQVISDDEITFLHHWLMDHPILENTWPAKMLLDKTTQILDDNIVTEEERAEISQMLNEVIGSPIEHGVASGMSTESPLDTDATVIIEGNLFMFSGKFAYGSRKKCEDITKELGGAVGGKDITLKTDFLVVGGTASEHWKFTNFGRKIQKAMDFRDERGTNLKIISEQQWADALETVMA